MKINILHIIDHYRIGGPGKTIINTAKYINASKYKIHVATFLPEDTETEFSLMLKRELVPHLKLKDNRWISFVNIKQIKRYTIRHNIKIIHCHDYKTDFHGYVYKLFDPKIIIVTTHHGWIRNSVSQKVFSKLALSLSGLFDGIITVSSKLMNELPKYSKRFAICKTVHNGILISDYKIREHRQAIRDKLCVNEDDYLVGVVGRLSMEKGSIYMIDAFHKATMANTNLKLVFIGEGPLKDKIIEKVRVLGLDKMISVAGYQNPVQPYFEALDCLVCPSHTEGLSNVVLEAFAYCIPVIATDVGGNTEIISNNKEGLIVEPNNVEAMKDAITVLSGSIEMQKKFGKNGHEKLIRKFTFEKRTIKAELFYQRVLLKKNKKLDSA